MQMILCFIVYQKELRFAFQVNDATFASEVLGKGIAVIPSKVKLLLHVIKWLRLF